MKWAAIALTLAAVLLAGCATPVGADRVSLREAYEERDRGILNSEQFSAQTTVVLHRHDLRTLYRKSPAEALQKLHELALVDDRKDILYAAAELSFAQADRQEALARQRYLAAAFYAYSYILQNDSRGLAFDRHFRDACDIYNRALAMAFTNSGDRRAAVQLQPGTRDLPFGSVQVAVQTNAFPWPVAQFNEFLSADAYKARGVYAKNQQSGIGAPLIAVGDALSHRYTRTVPATLFGRFNGGLREAQEGRATLTLELYSAYDRQTVDLAGAEVPLETDLTTAMAYALNDSKIWKLGSQQFLTHVERVKSDVYPFQTFERGRIPVVFVHGTFSSPVWWTEMMNALYADPILREKFQFWFFIYNSGKPITFSAQRLREVLQKQVEELDPEGTDFALRQMIVVGHSQGGLLTKLTATDTGDALWKTSFDEPIDALEVSEEKRELLRRAFFFEPLPFVDRVVFISTPHRGSYLATSFVRDLVQHFVRLPADVVDFTKTVVTLQVDRVPAKLWKRPPTSLDGMSPKSAELLALAEIPVATNVTAHSIVAIKGKAEPPNGGDGVVKYTSAHVPYAASEFIARSSHSCQDKPAVVEEVRRILLLHLDESNKKGGQ